MAELDPDEGVDHGVQAAPEEGHALRHVRGVQQFVVVVAVLGSSFRRDERCPEQNQVVRHLADEENGDHGQDDLDGLVALEVLRFAEGPDDAGVAEAHDQEREGEGQDDLADLDDHAQPVAAVGVRRARPVVDDGVGHLWRGQDQRNHPDQSRRHLAVEHGLGAVAVGGDGFGDAEVAVHADGGEEEHAAVKADLVDGVHGLAHHQAQQPLPGGVGRPKGQREGEEEVGAGQVEQVDVRHGLEPLEIEEGEDDQQVSGQAQEADDGVKGGHEPLAELTVVLFVADEGKLAVVHAEVVILGFRGGRSLTDLSRARL